MKGYLKTLIFCTALFGACTASAAIDALNFSSLQQESDYHQLTQALRCPQCQNNNIADSNAVVAVDMRGKVFELLQEGKSKDDVIHYMVERYGNFVTYDPPKTAGTLILWLAPLLLVLGGVIFLFKRKPKATTDNKSAVQSQAVFSAAEQARLAELLKKDK